MADDESQDLAELLSRASKLSSRSKRLNSSKARGKAEQFDDSTSSRSSRALNDSTNGDHPVKKTKKISKRPRPSTGKSKQKQHNVSTCSSTSSQRWCDAINFSSDEENAASRNGASTSSALQNVVEETAPESEFETNKHNIEEGEGVVAETCQSVAAAAAAAASSAGHQGDASINSTRNESMSIAFPSSASFLSPTSEFNMFDQSMVRTIRKPSKKKTNSDAQSEENLTPIGVETAEQKGKRLIQKAGERGAKGKGPKKLAKESHNINFSTDAQVLEFSDEQLPSIQINGSYKAASERTTDTAQLSPELYAPRAKTKPQTDKKKRQTPKSVPAGTTVKKSNKLLSDFSQKFNISDSDDPIEEPTSSAVKNKTKKRARGQNSEAKGTKSIGKLPKNRREKASNFFNAVKFSDSDSGSSDEFGKGSPSAGRAKKPAPVELNVPDTCDVSQNVSMSSSTYSTTRTVSESQQDSDAVDVLASRLSQILTSRNKKTKKAKTKTSTKKPKLPGSPESLTGSSKVPAWLESCSKEHNSLDLVSQLYKDLRVPSSLENDSIAPHSASASAASQCIPETQDASLFSVDEQESCQSSQRTVDDCGVQGLQQKKLYPTLPAMEESSASVPGSSDAEILVPETVETVADSTESTIKPSGADLTKCPQDEQDARKESASVDQGLGSNNFTLHLSVSNVQSPPQPASLIKSPSAIDMKMEVKADEPCESSCRLVFSPSGAGSPDVYNASLQVSLPGTGTSNPDARVSSPWSSAKKGKSVHASVHSPRGLRSPSGGHNISLHMSVTSPDPVRKTYVTSPLATSPMPETSNVSLQVSMDSLSVSDSSPRAKDQSAQISMSSLDDSNMITSPEASENSFALKTVRAQNSLNETSLLDQDLGNSYVRRTARATHGKNNESGICYQRQNGPATPSPHQNLFLSKPSRRSITFVNTEECFEYTETENTETDKKEKKVRAWRRQSAVSILDSSFKTARESESPLLESENEQEDRMPSFSASSSSDQSAFKTCLESDIDLADLEDDDSPIVKKNGKKKNRLSLKGRKEMKLLSVGTEAAADAAEEEEEEEDDDDGHLPDLTSPVTRREDVPVRSGTHSTNKCIQISDESEDEEHLENFLEQMRTPAPGARGRQNSDPDTDPDDRPSLEAFIVSDSDCSEEEDGVFYVAADRERTSHPNRVRSEDKENTCHRTVTIIDSPSSEDDFVRPPAFRTPKNPIAKPRSWTTRPGGRAPDRHADVVDTFATPLRSPLRNQQNTANGRTPLRYSFLRSLTATVPADKRDPDSARFIKQFKKHKEELCTKLFRLYNQSVFDNELPADLKIEWNSRLLKTAGYCAYKRVAGTNRTARIELSTKVCDSAERVRDTLIHELCHAAVWLIHGVNGGHGPHWKLWARKATRVHCDLPVISRCHSYTINYKFLYRCSSCGYQIGRHSKSLDTDKNVCGYCRSPFQLTVNTPRGPVAKAQTPRTPNKFALFVKENYSSLKKSHMSHKEVMNALSAEFASKNKIV